MAWGTLHCVKDVISKAAMSSSSSLFCIAFFFKRILQVSFFV